MKWRDIAIYWQEEKWNGMESFRFIEVPFRLIAFLYFGRTRPTMGHRVNQNGISTVSRFVGWPTVILGVEIISNTIITGTWYLRFLNLTRWSFGVVLWEIVTLGEFKHNSYKP